MLDNMEMKKKSQLYEKLVTAMNKLRYNCAYVTEVSNEMTMSTYLKCRQQTM